MHYHYHPALEEEELEIVKPVPVSYTQKIVFPNYRPLNLWHLFTVRHVFTVRLATFTVRRVYVYTCEHLEACTRQATLI